MTKIKLRRQLGLFDSVMIMVGIIIGSGIFVTTGIMAQHVPSAPLILLAWLVGGLLTLAGALTYAELGAAMPEAGGQYIYLKEAFGPLCGFLFGWIFFLVYMTGGIASLAVAFAEYFAVFVPALSFDHIFISSSFSLFDQTFHFSFSAGHAVAIFVLLFLSTINYVGLTTGKLLQNFLTMIKICALIFFIILGLAVGKISPIDSSLNPVGFSSRELFLGFGIALIAVSWAFDGWNNINFVAGEIKNPGRNIPLTLIIGALVVTLLYLLINVVYLFALPMKQIMGEIKIADKAASILFGQSMSTIFSAIVLISIFSSLNGSILTGPRVYYAMAKDGLFFRSVARVHAKYKVPGVAIFLQAVWSCLLALSGNFEQLITYTMFVSIIFWLVATLSVFQLRKKYPQLPRPYRTCGYPVVPIVFLLATCCILINTLLEKPVESLTGIGMTLIGVPVFYYWKRKGNNSAAPKN